ncbi:MAG: hypothetical protein HY923_07750 [Elusimicrobia bacterium]|nr:hypothetical protein [Elusimicrobiota bacterium]
MKSGPRVWGSAALLALCLAWAGAAGLRFAEGRPQERILSAYSASGEVLAHGIRARAPWISYRMPLGALVAARLHYHNRTSYGALLACARVLLVLLVFAAAMPLHPYGAAVGALAAAALQLGAKDLHLYPESGYTLLVLLCAGLLVRRARAPSPARTAALAAGLGASLLWRSPLAFFGPALALYERLSEPREARARRAEHLVLCLAPLAFLLPWLAMNWTIHGRLVPFEKGAASANLVTGSLGLIQDAHGNLDVLTGGALDGADTGAAAGWAAREALGHPLRFARAFLLRLRFALSFHPWLALFALGGLWAFRARREHRQLALLAAYFLALHCLLAVEERYFWPAYPMLALLAAGLPARLAGAGAPAAAAPESRLSSAILAGTLAFVLALCAHAEWKVLSFAAGARRGTGRAEEQLNAALRRHPDDAWLLGERGRERLSRGDSAGGAEDLARAAALEPESPSARLRAARAEALAGRTGSLLAWAQAARPAPANLPARAELEIMQAHALIRLGRRAQALERLGSARRALQDQDFVLRGAQDPRQALLEKDSLDKLASSDAEFVAMCGGLQGPAPEAQRRMHAELLTELLPASGEAWLARAEAELRAGDRASARRSTARAEAAAPAKESGLRLAALYRGLGDAPRAAALLQALTLRRPEDLEPWLARAALERAGGDRAAALASLARAEALPGDAAGEQTRRVALAYQDLAEHDRAISLLSRLARRHPGVASFLSDKGVCEHLKGDDVAALADLRAAVALDPAFLPAYLTLGAVHASHGRRAEALAAYEQALSRSAAEDADPLRPAVLAAREDLLKN